MASRLSLEREKKSISDGRREATETAWFAAAGACGEIAPGERKSEKGDPMSTASVKGDSSRRGPVVSEACTAWMEAREAFLKSIGGFDTGERGESGESGVGCMTIWITGVAADDRRGVGSGAGACAGDAPPIGVSIDDDCVTGDMGSYTTWVGMGVMGE